MEIRLTNSRVVAVDGGTATGKSRLVEELAATLRLKGIPVIHVSSGHLYRAAAYVVQRSLRGSAKDDPGAALRATPVARIIKLMQDADIQMHGGTVWLDGQLADVDGTLKGTGIGTGASIVSRQLAVREAVNAIIRRQINEFDGYVLIDGRDIGRDVVPDAPLKLLLVVSPEVAALRSREHTLEEIVARDEADRNREHGPLPRAEEVRETMVVMTTDVHTPQSARDEVYTLMQRTFAELPDLY